ncbi:acyl-CoA dehydrogenase [Trebonia kvetii]|uniref:Acyl-CoA dehydrogenase n=1 Tax=Trebonia kvetii TaxID=2480626 RepID=A0A6P2BMX4_9ACTN|nr:acyl-CoA dehydrogenase family protein [Trebonia kvetii]TVZ00364.1 acyl-CoA dehydrogenase [Trebonia kvetii]
MPSQESYRDALLRVIESVVAPGAAAVDASGSFPRAQVDALGAAGILGLTVPAEHGGGGAGLREAADVVRELGSVCGSTAMVVTMHYAAVAALTAAADKETLTAIAGGGHLSTLAFSERGSRSHFWAPLSTATLLGAGDEAMVRLNAHKSWVTAAGQADSYVWSSRPLDAVSGAVFGAAPGPMTLWLVPAGAAGLLVAGEFDGLGLRGNASAPMTADGVTVPLGAMLGGDGAGLDLALAAVLPVFLICSAAMSAGLMRRLADETAAHLRATRLEHLGVSLAQQSAPRARLARLRIEADRTWALVSDTIGAVEQGRDDAQLLVLEVKAAAGEAAADAADLALTAGGGAAYRKESVVERLFRDSRAARVMAPTTEALHDFIGRALLGLPLLGEA